MQSPWDERYAKSEYIYGTEPNQFFRQALERLPKPGRLLLPAEGEGRNAVFAASRGWQVDAYDSSTVGREKAMRLAGARGVVISYEVASHADAHLEPGAYDAVALIFAHQPPAERRALHERAAAALTPNGHLILEAYSKEQLRFGTGGPPVEEMLFSLDELRADFAGLELDLLERVEVDLQEGQLHRGVGSVVRLIARRPT